MALDVSEGLSRTLGPRPSRLGKVGCITQHQSIAFHNVSLVQAVTSLVLLNLSVEVAPW